jgi:hypothetical protein
MLKVVSIIMSVASAGYGVADLPPENQGKFFYMGMTKTPLSAIHFCDVNLYMPDLTSKSPDAKSVSKNYGMTVSTTQF